MCSYILYMHISAYAHTHIQAHSLMRALKLSCARTRARTRMHMHTTHTGARAQTRMHPGTCGPDYARTHAPAHGTRMHAHAHPQAHPHMHTCARWRLNRIPAKFQCVCFHFSTTSKRKTIWHKMSHKRGRSSKPVCFPLLLLVPLLNLRWLIWFLRKNRTKSQKNRKNLLLNLSGMHLIPSCHPVDQFIGSEIIAISKTEWSE